MTPYQTTKTIVLLSKANLHATGPDGAPGVLRLAYFNMAKSLKKSLGEGACPIPC